MAAAAESYIMLAQSLPPRLLRFFTRYKPRVNENPTVPPSLNIQPTTTLHYRLEPSKLPNPFRSFKNPETGRWREPIYSLRQQADLVKMARANGVEELLPYTVKGTKARTERRTEHGLRVKGTGLGQKVKGKQWERTMKSKLEMRKQAMEGMPKLIQEWKAVSHFVFRWASYADVVRRKDMVVDGRSFRNRLAYIGIWDWSRGSTRSGLPSTGRNIRLLTYSEGHFEGLEMSVNPDVKIDVKRP